jgi:hypothetical protein
LKKEELMGIGAPSGEGGWPMVAGSNSQNPFQPNLEFGYQFQGHPWMSKISA